MARRKNPLFDPISREIETAVGGSMVVVDQWFDEMDELRTELSMANELKEELVARILRHKKEGWTKDALKPDAESLKDVTKRINRLKREMKIVDRRIASYYKAALKDISERLDTIKALPGSGMYAREYRDAMRMLAIAKKQAQFANVDVRPKISQLRGAVKTLEEATEFARPSGLEVGLAGSRARLKPKKTSRKSKDEIYKQLLDRWRALRAHAVSIPEYKAGKKKMPREEIGGIVQWPRTSGPVRTIEQSKPRRSADPDINFARTVTDIDLLVRILNRRVMRGEPIQTIALNNLNHQMDILSSMIKERARRKITSPEAIISKIGKLRRDLLAMRKKTRRSPRDMEKMRARLEDVRGLVGAKMTKGWSQQDRKNARAGIRESEALLTSMERVMLPSSMAQRLGISPSKKHRIGSKSIAKRSGNPKRKKATKKKRATTPEWQRLNRRCQKLWEHYCERPGKTRLQAVLKHLETMKGSTSKKVLDERKRCLRAANAEAKRLKLKR